MALLFIGTYIMSQLPRLTILVLKKGNASLVFDRPSYVNNVDKKGNETIFTLQANTVEYRDVGVPCDSPELHTLAFKEGMIYYEYLGRSNGLFNGTRFVNDEKDSITGSRFVCIRDKYVCPN